MTLLPVNHCFHRIRILIISDGLVTGAVILVGETVVNFVNISSFSVHDALVTQGGITLLLAHDILLRFRFSQEDMMLSDISLADWLRDWEVEAA